MSRQNLKALISLATAAVEHRQHADLDTTDDLRTISEARKELRKCKPRKPATALRAAGRK